MSFHTVFTTTDNRPVIDDAVSTRMQEIFTRVKGNLPIEISSWQWAPDHVIITAQVAGIMSGLPAVLRRFRIQCNKQVIEDFPAVAEAMEGSAFLAENDYMKKMADDQE